MQQEHEGLPGALWACQTAAARVSYRLHQGNRPRLAEHLQIVFARAAVTKGESKGMYVCV